MFDKPCPVMALKPMSNRGSSEKTEARHRSAPRSLFGMDGFVTGPTLAVLFVTVWQIFIAEFGANAPVSPAASAIPGVIPVRPQPDSSVPTKAKKSKAPRKSRGQR